jgi:hypothetical protein
VGKCAGADLGVINVTEFFVESINLAEHTAIGIGEGGLTRFVEFENLPGPVTLSPNLIWV